MFRVSSLWLYFARGTDRLSELKKVLGPAFSEDLDPHYTHLLLIVELNAKEIRIGLRIHPKAWWEGQNLKQKCEKPAERTRCVELLNQIPDTFSLALHNWARTERCGSVRLDELGHFLRRYTPGEHWVALNRIHPREKVLEAGEELSTSIASDLARLVPFYQFIAWSKKNNHLFSS